MNRLYFFTSTFPYGNGETFIESEIKILTKYFDVKIIPSRTNGFQREIYEAELLNLSIPNNKIRFVLGGLYRTKLSTLIFFIKTFIRDKCFRRIKFCRNHLLAFLEVNWMLSSSTIKKVLLESRENDFYYFYWAIGAAYILPFISKNKGQKIVRFHGGDLYEVRNGGYLPYRTDLLESLDLAVFISKNGEKYLKERYKNIPFKSILSYLGTNDYGICSKSLDGVLRIVSCSNVIALKRVLLIFESLQLIDDIPIEWTHIGDGIEFKQLSQKVSKNRNKNLKIKLLGRLTNSEVIEFYKNNPIDLFINVSLFEGISVSLMEAISFNIPAIATDVGGTSEIINLQTGKLLSENPSIQEISETIINISKYNKFEPRTHWEIFFNAKNNYNEFCQILLENVDTI